MPLQKNLLLTKGDNLRTALELQHDTCLADTRHASMSSAEEKPSRKKQ